MTSCNALYNSDAQQPQDIGLWPLAMIVNLSYTLADLQVWGHEAFIKHIRANSKDSFYQGETTSTHYGTQAKAREQ